MAEERDDAGSSLWATASLLTPMAIRVAATLRIADHLDAGPRSPSELAAAVDADPDSLDRVLAHLATIGVLIRDRSGRYELTPRGAPLREGHPERMRAALDLDGALGRAELCCTELLHTVLTGQPAFPVRFGRSFWDDLTADSVRAASFDAQMGGDVAVWAPAIVAAYDWSSLGRVIDVGGGDGSLMVALLSEHPKLRGVVLERPGAAAAAQKALTVAGLAGRSDVVAGSFFDPLPEGADGYLLTAVVHDWDDESARAVLRRCRDAAGADGRVFVIEKIGTDGETPNTEMDLRMLALFGGRERELGELVALGASSGLAVAGTHTAGAIVILELVPVSPGRSDGPTG